MKDVGHDRKERKHQGWTSAWHALAEIAARVRLRQRILHSTARNLAAHQVAAEARMRRHAQHLDRELAQMNTLVGVMLGHPRRPWWRRLEGGMPRWLLLLGLGHGRVGFMA